MTLLSQMNMEVGQEESVENEFFPSQMQKKDTKEMKREKAVLTLLDGRRGIFRDNSDLFVLVLIRLGNLTMDIVL